MKVIFKIYMFLTYIANYLGCRMDVREQKMIRIKREGNKRIYIK